VHPLERDGSRWDFEDVADDPELGLLRSTVVAPLCIEDQLVGVLALYHVAAHPYVSHDLARLVALGPRVARALAPADAPQRTEPVSR
jgi:GAF domain-containing protein